jgi:hypothetical protein
MQNNKREKFVTHVQSQFTKLFDADVCKKKSLQNKQCEARRRSGKRLEYKLLYEYEEKNAIGKREELNESIYGNNNGNNNNLKLCAKKIEVNGTLKLF